MSIFSRKNSDEETARTEDNARHSTWDQPSDLGDTDLMDDSDLTMSMEDIDKLFDEDELNRLLNDDVDDFIRSSDFQDLLNAEDIDDILSLYHKEEEETSEEPELEEQAAGKGEQPESVESDHDRVEHLVFEKQPNRKALGLEEQQPEEETDVYEESVSPESEEPVSSAQEEESEQKEETGLSEEEYELTQVDLDERFSDYKTTDSGKSVSKEEEVSYSESEEFEEKEEPEEESGKKKFKLEITQEVAAAVLAPEPQEDQMQTSKEPVRPEQSEEISYDDFEEDVPLSPKKKGRYAALGIILTVLAVIGIVAVGVWGYHFAKGLLNQTDAKEEFNNIVYPLVVVDVPEFETADKLDSKVVIAAGIWNFLMNETNMDKYEQDELGSLTVPAVDIEVYIRQLFGSKVQIDHQQVSDFEFYYDPDTEIYQIPASPQVLPYAPSVQSVVHTGSDYTVEVGYILPGPFWNVGEYAVNGEINKLMIYHYKKDQNGNYIIQSVERDANTVISGLGGDDVSYPEGYADDESDVSEESNVSSEDTSGSSAAE